MRVYEKTEVVVNLGDDVMAAGWSIRSDSREDMIRILYAIARDTQEALTELTGKQTLL